MEQGNLIPVVKWTKKNYASKHAKQINYGEMEMEEEMNVDKKLTMESYQKEDSIIKKRHPNICHWRARIRRGK